VVSCLQARLFSMVRARPVISYCLLRSDYATSTLSLMRFSQTSDVTPPPHVQARTHSSGTVWVHKFSAKTPLCTTSWGKNLRDQQRLTIYRTDEENTHQSIEHHLHETKFGVWCGVNRRRIIGTHLCNKTINSHNYAKSIIRHSLQELTNG
jgi:hypothetical protein